MKYVFYVTTILSVAPFIVSGVINIFQQRKSSVALQEAGISYVSPLLLGCIKIAGVTFILLPPSFELLNLSGYTILLIQTGCKWYYNCKYGVAFLNLFIVFLVLFLLASASIKFIYLQKYTL